MLGYKIAVFFREKKLLFGILLLSCPISHHLLVNVFDFKNSPYNVRILLPPPKKKPTHSRLENIVGVFLLGKIYIQLNLPESLV